MPRKNTKKGKAPTIEDAEYSPPTKERWNKMLKYGSFQVADTQGRLHKFSRNDTATILPHGKPPGEHVIQSEYWVGEILEIKATNIVDEQRSNDVWAKVRWWYSAQDASSVIRSFDPANCSPYERIYAEDTDIVSSQAFNEVTDVKWLRDDDIEQPYIAPDDFYARYEINRRAKRLDPKPGGSSCTCGVPYAFHDSTVMHFCPRPSCRRWYHQTCLVDAKSLFNAPALKTQKSPGKAKRGRPSATKNEPVSPLLLTSPDTTTVIPNTGASRPVKRRRMSTRGSGSVSPQKGDVILGDLLEDSDREDGGLGIALARLPTKLVQLASQPIVRGSLFTTGGVSGNVRPVALARRLVHDVLGLGEDDTDQMSVEYGNDSTRAERGEVPGDWEDRVLGPEPEVTLNECIVKIEGKKGIPLLECPECGSAI